MSGNADQLFDLDYVCCVCSDDEEITTIQLDVSRVVLPPADDGRGAETHQVAHSLFTFSLYAVGMYFLLGADSSTRGPELPTRWSQYVSYMSYNIKTETITLHFGIYQMFLIGVIIVLVVLIEIWSRRCEEKKTDQYLHGTEDDQEQCLCLF